MAAPGKVTLVRGRWVVTNAHAPIHPDSAVVVCDGLVTEIAPFDDARARYPAAEVLGSAGHAVIPGLVNAHHHSHAVTYTQHGRPERPLETYLPGLAAVRGCDRELDGLICGARLLSTGVTTAIDLFTGGGSADDVARDIGALRRGYDRAGVQVAVAAGIATHGNLVYGEGGDEAFIASLPAKIAARAHALMPSGPQLSEDEYFGIMADAAADTKLRGWLWFSFPGPEWVTDQFMQEIAKRAAALGTRVQTHAIESPGARRHSQKVHGALPLLHLADLGVLGPEFSIAHGTWMTAREIDRLAESGACLVVNPGSNLRLFAGIAPLAALRAAGVPLALGMDGTTLHDDEDMFGEMRLALRVYRDPLAPAAEAMSPADVLALATTGGAKLMGLEAQCGKIAPGKPADLVLLDMRRPLWPWVEPNADPLSLIVLRVRRGDVDTVMVGGEIVWRDGAPTRFDLGAAVAEVAAEAAAAMFPAERAAAVEAVVPHLAAWYGLKPAGFGPPFTAWNSRR